MRACIQDQPYVEKGTLVIYYFVGSGQKGCPFVLTGAVVILWFFRFLRSLAKKGTLVISCPLRMVLQNYFAHCHLPFLILYFCVSTHWTRVGWYKGCTNKGYPGDLACLTFGFIKLCRLLSPSLPDLTFLFIDSSDRSGRYRSRAA